MALVGKDQLVHEVAERSELGIAEARRALEEMLTAIETQLAGGNEVRLTGFGKFSVSRRKARDGRNPQTGEAMQIAARKVPHFSPGAELRNAVPQAAREGASKSESKTTKTKASATSSTKQAANRSANAKRRKDQSPGKQTTDKPDEASRQGGTTDETPSGNEEASPEDKQTSDAPEEQRPEDEETIQKERKRPKGTRRGPRIPRKRTTRKGGTTLEDEAAPDSSGVAEGESAERDAAGKALSVAGSGAKYAFVVAAGLAAGVAGGLAVMHRR